MNAWRMRWHELWHEHGGSPQENPGGEEPEKMQRNSFVFPCGPTEMNLTWIPEE